MTNLIKTITSIQNQTIKQLLQLQEKSKVRTKSKQFIVEGLREIDMAIMSNYKLEQVYVKQPFDDSKKWLDERQISEDRITLVSKEVYQKIAYRENTEGIVGLFNQKTHNIEHLKLNKNALLLVAEGIEKPGNIGAILRTADAANIDAVILANPVTDLYNPNVIRSSLGGVFTNQIAIGSSEEIKEFLIKMKFKIFSATLQNANDYCNENYSMSTAIVVGSEANGVSDVWRTADCNGVYIPMHGKLDSMNVSVASAVLIFEAVRQRNKF